jgi:hypothetical protein
VEPLVVADIVMQFAPYGYLLVRWISYERLD